MSQRIGIALLSGLLAACLVRPGGEVARPVSHDAAPRPALIEPAEPRPVEASLTVPADPALVARAQSLLAGLGYDPGAVDGIEGERTAAAVRDYQADTGLEADGEIGEALVDRLADAWQARLVRPAQKHLAVLGYDPGPVDGRYGPRTRAAVAAFKADSGLPTDGRLTPTVLDRLAAALPRPQPTAPEAPAPVSTVTPVIEAADGEGDHALVPGDRVRIKLFAPNASTVEAEVQADGTLSLPGIGVVQADGLEPAELEDEIAVKLLENYLRSLLVRVDVADAAETETAAGRTE